MSTVKINPAVTLNPSEWVGGEAAAQILGLEKKYFSRSVKSGYLKGRITYRSVTGKNYQYLLSDIEKLLEQATVPSHG